MFEAKVLQFMNIARAFLAKKRKKKKDRQVDGNQTFGHLLLHRMHDLMPLDGGVNVGVLISFGL